MNKLEKNFNEWEKKKKNGRINAICKPCWELNYCPYGPLVEQFPLDDTNDYGCKIFGHICPVFIVAEPLTETKEERNISRNIPTKVKLQVFKRDGGVCQKCHKNIPEDEINFDHIIPWSKGGSSSVSNIRILCQKCNKQRGNRYEEEYLKIGINETYHDPLDLCIDQVKDLLTLTSLWCYIEKKSGTPSEMEYCEILGSDDNEMDKFMYSIISNLMMLLNDNKPIFGVKIKMRMLQYRWGLTDGNIYSATETCNKFNKEISYYVELEANFFRRIGFILEENKRNTDEYYNLKVSPVTDV